MSVTFSLGLSHADYLALPAVSASDLIAIDQSCPSIAWSGSAFNPARVAHEDTEATAIGTATHMAILEPDRFALHYAIRPDGIDGRTKSGKEWFAAQEEAGREVLSTSVGRLVGAMRDAVRGHKLASAALRSGKPEVTMAWADAETGLACKARPDWLREPAHVFDVKSTIDAHPAQFSRQASNLRYYMRAAWTLDALRLSSDEATYSFIVIEKTAPHPVIVAAYNSEAIEWARIQNRAALRRFADCLSSGKWPGYSDEHVVELSLPEWAARTLQHRHERGEFSPEPAKIKDVTMAGD